MPRLRDFKGIEGSNFFEQDRGLQSILSALLSESERDPVFDSLKRCGALVGGPWNELAREAGRVENLPRIVKQDRVGTRIEWVDYGPLARQHRREVSDFGVLTETRNDLHRFAIVYLLAHNGEGSVNCGLSCTDGLIRALEARGSDFLRETYLDKLRSSDTPLAGAQFVTEQDGGSDVGAIEASASLNPDGSWSITGEKWFCSNPDEYFLVAARPRSAASGTAGVAVFLVPRVLPDGTLNAISFRRLKNKLGTQSLPTAEIDFQEATAWAIGPIDEGFKTLMTYVINVSRIHNAANACGILHRAFLEARNYARQRETFGRSLITSPLIQETLVGLLERLWRYRLLTFKLIAQIDEIGIAPADPGQRMWQRFLINLAKYRTGLKLTDSVREAILILGGNGIVEDFTVLPRLLRDSMIIETWEGPHNTLCLQIMRDAARSDLVGRWRAEVSHLLEIWPPDFLSYTRAGFERLFQEAVSSLSRERLLDPVFVTTHARRLVDRMGLLLEMGWLAEFALDAKDSTAGLLVSAAGHFEICDRGVLDHPVLAALASHGLDLIEEQSINADVSGI
jgi:alkylation response protein AidB-like acyl-CoA dehydrogenase